MSPRVSDLFLRSQSDERLVHLARAGHARAFGAIVERYGPELSALARRLRPHGKDEDLVQQAFLSAFAALQAGSEVKHLRGWLYQIVRNTSTRDRPMISVPLDGALPAPDTLEDVVAHRARAMDALSELSRLPERQRQAIIASALDGMGRAETARAMGLSEGAVRQLIHRARQTLRSAVTAVTPGPVAKWVVARSAARTGAIPAAGGGAVSVGGGGAASVGGGGALSSGGAAIKLGVVLASGTLATGIATVAFHPAREHGRDAGAAHAARLRAVAPGAPTVALATASPSAGAGDMRIGSTGGTPGLAVNFVSARARAGAAGFRGAPRAEAGRSRQSNRGPAEQRGSQRSGGGAGAGPDAGGGWRESPQSGGGGQRNGGFDQQQSSGSDPQRSGGSQPAGGSDGSRPAGGGDTASSVGSGPTAFASQAPRDGQPSDQSFGQSDASTATQSLDGSGSGGSGSATSGADGSTSSGSTSSGSTSSGSTSSGSTSSDATSGGSASTGSGSGG